MTEEKSLSSPQASKDLLQHRLKSKDDPIHHHDVMGESSQGNGPLLHTPNGKCRGVHFKSPSNKKFNVNGAHGQHGIGN